MRASVGRASLRCTRARAPARSSAVRTFRSATGSNAAAAPQLERVQAEYSVTALAFLGDAVWSLHLRHHYLLPPKHSTKYHDAVDKHAAAELQALYYDRLLGAPSGSGTPSGSTEAHAASGRAAKPPVFMPAGSKHRAGAPAAASDAAAAALPPFKLSVPELEMLDWAWSQPVTSFRERFRQGPEQGTAQLAYQKATVFEALLGFLAVTDPERLRQLLAALAAFLPAN